MRMIQKHLLLNISKDLDLVLFCLSPFPSYPPDTHFRGPLTPSSLQVSQRLSVP